MAVAPKFTTLSHIGWISRATPYHVGKQVSQTICLVFDNSSKSDILVHPKRTEYCRVRHSFLMHPSLPCCFGAKRFRVLLPNNTLSSGCQVPNIILLTSSFAPRTGKPWGQLTLARIIASQYLVPPATFRPRVHARSTSEQDNRVSPTVDHSLHIWNCTKSVAEQHIVADCPSHKTPSWLQGCKAGYSF